MSSDGPDDSDWVSPGQPAVPPAYFAPPGGEGWGSFPPPPPPPYGWSGGAPGWPQPAPKPGVIPLRPLGVGEILDGSFTTIRRYPAATLGLAAMVILVVELVQVPLSYYLLHGVTTDVSGRMSAVTGITQLLTLGATIVLSGLLTAVVGQAVLGRSMSMTQAWRTTAPRLLRLVGATLLIALIAIVIGLVGVLPGIVVLIAGSHVAGIALIVIGAIAAFFVDFYIWIALSLTTPVLVLEKQGVVASLRRSRALIKGSWWRVFGITLLAGIIAGVLSGIIIAPFRIDSFVSIFSHHPDEQYRFLPLLLTGIGTLIANTLVRPFSAGVIALLYIDRRMRAEALDMTLQRSAASNP